MSRRAYSSPLREENAARTRQVILDAALSRFARQGYAGTSVAQIATTAGVAVTTVYASVGGKAQLIQALAQRGSEAGSIEDFLTQLTTMTDGREIVRSTARSTAGVTQELVDTITLLIENRLSDPAVSAAHDLAASVYRDRLRTVAERLHACGALRPDLTVARAGEILWFHFGFGAWLTVRDLGWGPERAAEWLGDQAAFALLSPSGVAQPG